MNHRKVAERSYLMQLSRTTVLLICVAVVTMTSIGLSTFSLFLPPIETEFGWSRTMVTVPYTVSMIGWAVGAVLFGKLADDFGTRGVILAGIVLMSVGFFGMGCRSCQRSFMGTPPR